MAPSRSKLRLVLAVATAVLLASAAVAVAVHAGTGRGLTHTVGVFVVLAELLRDGVLYPATPTVDLVYSTFYHPLAFAPIALLPGHGIHLLPALRVLVGTETLLCLGIVCWLVRSTGVRGVLSWQPSLWAISTVPVAYGLLAMRDDPRACLFQLLAIAAFLRVRRIGPELSAAFLVAAFMTKATAAAAPGLALLFLAWRRGGPRTAVRLLAWCALGTAAAVGYLQWGLGVDFLGNGLYYVLHPAHTARSWAETFTLLGHDLIRGYALAIVLGASLVTSIWALLARRAHFWEVLVWATWLKTIVAYRSVGTDLNHLFDLSVFAALQLGIAIGPRLRPTAALLALPILFAVGWPQPWRTWIPEAGTPAIADSPVALYAQGLRQILARRDERVLCEEPLIAWEAGATPLVTDPLLTFAALRDHPEIRAAWFGPLDQPASLRTLVLMHNPLAAEPDPAEWYGKVHFDAAFLEDVRANWEVVASDERATVLTRKLK